jgi:hypothetical protein
MSIEHTDLNQRECARVADGPPVGQIGLTSTEPRRAGLPVLLKAGNHCELLVRKMHLEECLKRGTRVEV